MLKPTSKRRRNPMEMALDEEFKSEASQDREEYQGEIKRLKLELA